MENKSCNNFISYVGLEEHEIQVTLTTSVYVNIIIYSFIIRYWRYLSLLVNTVFYLQTLSSSRRNSLIENSIKLLPGEVLIAEAQSVLMFSPVSDLKQGISGVLSVTNFKLTFITSDDSNGEVTAIVLS